MWGRDTLTHSPAVKGLINIIARQHSDYRLRFQAVLMNQAFESGSSFGSSGTFFGVAAAPELV
jgi:hypothetical protein